MPKKAHEPAKGSGSFSISYSTIGVMGSILVMLVTLVTIGSKIATKADVDSIKSTITPVITQHEDRIRALEIQMARYFGASQTGLRTQPSSEVDMRTGVRLVLAQYQFPTIPDTSSNAPLAQAPSAQRPAVLPPRRVVVPTQLIREYEMQPTRGGTYALLGEDGRYYSLDDVLAVIIQIHVREPQVKK
jgi:hypothetical protein